MSKKYKYFSIFLFPLAVFINFVASKFPNIVEKVYSTKLNKFFIEKLSKITGLFNFSLYELTMYILFISILLFFLYLIFKILTDLKSVKNTCFNFILNSLSIFSICYFIFIIAWGINYNRLPLEHTLLNNYNSSNNTDISEINYSNDSLRQLYKFLINKANKTRSLTLEDNQKVMKANTDYKGIISRAKLGYDKISNLLPQTAGNYADAKFVKSSNLMCYTGITGIYFPFTGEANVNIAIPDIYIPSTVLHEMAHQRGFASEDEANFIAYLASINHPDPDFNYSGYILALNHTASALKKADPIEYNRLTHTISQSVRNDLINNNDFWSKYEGQIDEISNKFNDSYLKSNGIREGTKSYGKMVDLLLIYYALYPYNN